MAKMHKWIVLAVLIVLIDQASKLWVLANFTRQDVMQLTPWLNFILAFNYGAAFSFLGDAGGWQRWFFTALAVGVSAVLIVWIYRLPINARWMPLTLSLILGGAVGNVIDRVRFGYVVDFIDFHIGSWHFATFNVADMAITVGAIMLLIDAFFLSGGRDRVE